MEEMGARQLDHALCLPNGLEMSRPASASILARTRFAAAGRVGSIELLGAVQVSTSHWWGASGSKITVSWPTSTSPYLSAPARS